MSSSSEDRKALAMALLLEEIEDCEKVVQLVGEYVKPYLNKQPRRTSNLAGAKWVSEVLRGNDIVCHENFRLEKRVFHHLCAKLVEHGLRRTTSIGIEEMVAMFMVTVGHGHGNRIIQERFQHSGETVSRDFHCVLEACMNLARENIKPLDPEFRQCHPKIENDPRYYPYFKDAIGAIDGTHIKAVVSASDKPRFIGRKGYPTQNIMAVCDWDMCFQFVLAGWEGTAHDARLFREALTTEYLNFPHLPQGKYYLVDSGYPTPDGFLGPYRRERCHLPDFRRQHGFSNHNEVFNYYHSSLRCTIERTFGVWKNRFRMLEEMRPFSFQTQGQIVCATMAIHNLIRRNSQTDMDFREGEQENITTEHNDHQSHEGIINIRSSNQMSRLRDTIRDHLVRDM